MTDLDSPRRDLAVQIEQARLALAAAPPQVDRPARANLANLLLRYISWGIGSPAENAQEGEPWTQKPPGQLFVLLYEARSLVDGLLSTRMGSDAEHRTLTVLLAECILMAGCLDEDDADEGMATALLEHALRPEEELYPPGYPDRGRDWWVPE